jgi:thiol-disulfide isomerase/thioredoxin
VSAYDLDLDSNVIDYRFIEKNHLPHSIQTAAYLFSPTGVFSAGIEQRAILNLLEGNDSCEVFELRFPDFGDVTRGRAILQIHKVDNLPRLYREEFTVKGEFIWNEFQFSKFSFIENHLIEKQRFVPIATKALPGANAFESYPMLGKKLTSFSGIRIGTFANEQIVLNKNVTLVDFWYMSCLGCILAYPVLDSLQKEFGRQINFIGLNGIDTAFLKREKLRMYIEKYNINHNTYLLSKTDYDKLFYGGTPLFLLIDRTGVVRFSTIGFQQGLYEALKKQIIQLINETQ